MSGTAALEAARPFQPDVILDGSRIAWSRRLLRPALRQEPAFKRVQMIAISGYGQSEDRRRSQSRLQRAPGQAGEF